MSMNISEIAFQNLQALDVQERGRLERCRYAASTIVVPAGAPALEVAAIADMTQAYQVLVTDEEGNLSGLLLPQRVKSLISEYMDMPMKMSLKDSLTELIKGPEEEGRTFRRLRLNMDRPVMVMCRGGHLADSDPCDDHK